MTEIMQAKGLAQIVLNKTQLLSYYLCMSQNGL